MKSSAENLRVDELGAYQGYAEEHKDLFSRQFPLIHILSGGWNVIWPIVGQRNS